MSNTTFIEVSKVTITDTTTVLDFFARIRPNTRMKITQSCHLTDEKGNFLLVQYSDPYDGGSKVNNMHMRIRIES